MTLSLASLQERLKPRAIRFYPQVDSTNDLALAWLRDGAPIGSTIIADEQVKGRGRLERVWYTPPGTALIMSVILRPRREHLPQMTMLGAVAIAELAEFVGLQAGIKWPNDVQVNGKKISGVLAEAAWEGDQLRGVVIGMGVNVRIDFSATELAQTAISLEPALGKPLNRLDLLAHLLERIDYWYAHLGSPALFEAWRGRLNMLGKNVTVSGVTGVAETVESDGTLLVRDTTNILRRVIAGDIALGSEADGNPAGLGN